MKNKFLFILTNPLFLSLILTLILLITLPPLFSKYKIELLKKEKNASLRFNQYCDLNNDGYSEEIVITKSYKSRTNILVSEKGKVINQWNFTGNLSMPKLFFGDFNNDGLKEIFLFTIFKNKILLNCFNPFENKRYIIDKYIDDFYPKNGEEGCTMTYCSLIDLNEDKKKELVFAFSPGYSLYPRKLFYYNFENDSLHKSPESRSPLEKISVVTDPTDKIPYFLISANSAVGNGDSNDVYTDYHTWLMVFKKDLTFKFEPVKIGYYPSNLHVATLKINNKLFLIALNIYFGKENIPCSIALYDFNGNKIREKEFPYTTGWQTARLFVNNGQIFLLKKTGSIEKVDRNLNFTNKQKILDTFHQPFIKIDIDLDNEKEFIFYHRNQEKITILRNNFSDPVIVDTPGSNGIQYCSVILNGKNKPLLFLNLGNYSFYYNYYKNPYYNIRFLFYGLIFFGIWGFLFVLQKAQKYRAEHKFLTEKKIAELQIKSIKNQTDPHFTLNIINSIGSLFAKQETEKANYIFGKYSKLLRSTIINSDKIITTLDDELDYVENYLSLEQFRLKDGLNIEINKDEGINGEIKIPKMLIHTFVENSVKHGIKHLEGKGKILISISKGNDLYKIKILDNGVGRKKAKEYAAFSTGKGLEILDKILDLYFTLEKVKISYEFKDLGNEGTNLSGTEVLIKIPILNLK